MRKLTVIALSFSVAIGASSCSAESSSPSSITESSGTGQETDLSKDTRGEWVQIQSDNVSMAGYDASTQTMTVMFGNGKSYWYQPVDQSVWTAFYNAQPHPWSQVGYSALVESGVPYGRLN
jgi:hypothetical protein